MPRDKKDKNKGRDWKDHYREHHNVKDEPFEQPDGSYGLTPVFDIPDEMLGLILTPSEDKVARMYDVPFEAAWAQVPVPDVLPADPLYTGYANIPASAKIDGHTKGYWTSQTGGTCGGFGTAEGQMDDFSTPDDYAIFDGMDRYFAIREGQVPPGEVKNINAGVQSAWVKAALLDPKKGGRRRGVGAWLPRDPRYNASSCWWGSNWQEVLQVVYNSWLRFTNQISTPRMGSDIGIPIYAAFLSPKAIVQADGSSIHAVYWQDGSWGAFKGGHWMRIAGFSRKIKVRPGSAGSVFLPGTWADQGFPEAWMAVEDLMKCLGAGGDILMIASNEIGPVGKLDLKKASITPAVPIVGDKVQFTFEVANVGEGKLLGIQLGIEEKYGDVYPDGFRGPVVDLEPGATASLNPITEPMTAGHKRWRFDNLKPYTILSTIEVDVTEAPIPPPPPPPPPPSGDTFTFAPATITLNGKLYTTAKDHPDGVIFRAAEVK